MLFRSSIALLLIFSFVTTNASPFDRRVPESPTAETAVQTSPDAASYNGNEPTPAVIAFDKCAKEIHGSDTASPASSPTPDSNSAAIR
ncbi:hypothetical protein BCR42DRAFT_435252 [Absidia repens]|uniref:Uncharacterized protein n=1 Tax=Absidia repens TaxID=90262 RepID=A0A1X2IPB8_9FUNG|nr:hypothetical protein BCR42DRAFT_435252 [Absidia repens]